MQEKKRKTWGREFHPKARYTIPFFVVLALLTVVSFIIPLRPTQSYSEKRSLAEFPEFSVEALVSGSYFDDINLWFSDTFPGRESWIKISRWVQSHHGHSEILIQGDIPMEHIPEETTVPPTTVPPTTVPVTEVTEPEETVPPTLVLEEVTAPTTPIEQWGGLDVENAVVNVGAVIQIDDYALGYFSLAEPTTEWYADNVNRLAAALEGKDVRLISAPPPSAIGVMVEEEYMEMLKCEPQDVALDYLHSLMDESVIKVDTVRNLIPHNDEYLYFRTDHHWAPLAAYYTYEKLMQTLDMEAAALEDFETMEQGEFKGSLYYRCSNPDKLTPDTVTAYYPKGELNTMLYDGKGSGFEWDLISDMSNSDEGTKYMCFLAGDHALSVVTNESIPDGPSCLIVKDSYGNCFVPFMAQNYHKVYAIDYRKYYKLPISKFVAQYEIDDVFLMTNLGAIQNTDVNKLLSDLLK